MTRRDEATALLRQGHSPSQIAALMHTRASEVMHYLHTKIGQGELRRSDIAFSLNRGMRQAVEEALAAGVPMSGRTDENYRHTYPEPGADQCDD